MDIRASLKRTKTKIAEDNARYNRLLKIPQRRQSPFEIAAYAFVPLILIMMGALPTVALFFVPALLPLLYLLFRRFGALLPLSCIGFYGLFALIFNYDVLTVIYFMFLIFAVGGLILSAQLRPYLLCMAVAAFTAVIGSYFGLMTVRLSEGVPLGDVAERYIYVQRDDPFIRRLATNKYDKAKIPDDIGKKLPDDEGYYDAVIEYYADFMKDDMDTYLPYYCMHYGAVFALLAYFIAVEINRRTASPADIDAKEEEVRISTRALGGVYVELTPIRNMKFPRSYLWTVLLPGLLASILLDIVGGYGALSATVMHAAITMPTAAAFVSLALYFCSLFDGKPRVVALALFYVLMAAMVMVPMVLFVCSVIGLCDIIINLRFWSDYLLSD